MIGVPFLVLGLLLVLSAIVGARVEARRGSVVGTFVLSLDWADEALPRFAAAARAAGLHWVMPELWTAQAPPAGGGR